MSRYSIEEYNDFLRQKRTLKKRGASSGTEDAGAEMPPVSPQAKKRSKYGALKDYRCCRCAGRATKTGGCLDATCGNRSVHTFDSKTEARRFDTLMLWERLGQISKVELQPAYPIEINGIVIATYYADFRYVDENGKTVVLDVKSEPTRTPVYRLKKKAVEAQYGIKITEVK